MGLPLKARLRESAFAIASAIALASPSYLSAAEIKGLISQVDVGGNVHIQLAQGDIVAPGDKVKILAEIPGVGMTAMSSLWQVQSFGNGVAVAMPVEAGAGTPQVGYTALIESEAAPVSPQMPPQTAQTAAPDMTVSDEPMSPEAMNLFLSAQQLAMSGNPSDHADAANLYRQAAEMRHPGAMTDLGVLYSFGRGVTRDDAAALQWQDLASRYGSSDAMYRVGLIYMTGWGTPVDVMMASDRFHKAAAYGNANAMYMLAMLYEDGIGVQASMTEMVSWLEEAAGYGHTEAMYVLGEIYVDGEDGIIAKDIVKAEDYWLAAAQAGNVRAMGALGEFYEGEALMAADRWSKAARNAPQEPDYMKDLRCLSAWECYIPDAPGAGTAQQAAPPAAPQTPPVAAIQPSPEIWPAPAVQPASRVTHDIQDCDRVAAAPRDPDRPNVDLAIDYNALDGRMAISECLEDIKAWPDTRRFHAQIARGYYKVGIYDEAFQAAMTGAQLGSSQAMAMVAMMYKTGRYVPQDANQALEWFEKAGFQGNVTAMHFAAGMHLHAQGVSYNPYAAAEWFQAAADLGSAPAMASLGILYDNGQGVDYDPDEAAANLMAGLAMGADEARTTLLETPDQLSPHTRIAIQSMLRDEGSYSGALDGDFGPQTLQALRARIMN